jgi:dihydroorotase
MSNPPKLDLLLKGGHVIDPANDIDGTTDIGITDGKIARVGEDIPTDDAQHIIDVSSLSVTPGLIDIHTHAYWTTNIRPGPRSMPASKPANFVRCR